MFWEILAWTGVVLIYVFRIAIVVGIVAAVFLIVRSHARCERPGTSRRSAGPQIARAGVTFRPGRPQGDRGVRVSGPGSGSRLSGP